MIGRQRDLSFLTNVIEGLEKNDGRFYFQSNQATGDIELHYFGRNGKSTAQSHSVIELEIIHDQRRDKIRDIAQKLVNWVEYELDPYGIRA